MYVYVIVYNKPAGMVFVAFKKVMGSRFEGKPIAKPSVLNNSGQVVFPGGYNNKQPTAMAAGLEEFVEETGIKLEQYIDGDKFTVKSFQEGKFHGIYAEIDAEFMQALVENANANTHHGQTWDDELNQMGFISINHACESLGTWDASLTTPEATKVLVARGEKKMYDPFDKSWFKAMLDHLINILKS